MKFNIAVLPGDGIGREVTACVEVLTEAARQAGNFELTFETMETGAALYEKTGNAFPPAARQSCEQADAILLGAMGLPSVRYPDGTEIAPQLDLRFDYELFAGVRPIRPMPGIAPKLADPRARDMDFVLIRESTEGLFASRGKGTVEDDRIARDFMEITRDVSERLFRFSFELARSRKRAGRRGLVTCVDKANVFTSFAFFRKIFDEIATEFPDIESEHAYVDALALNMVQRPWDFDVMVTENMFGDILSDLGAGLIGGMGFAPSADIGDKHAVFQPAHGSAPDIAGQNKANPTAMLLSGAMMLEWLGESRDVPSCIEAGRRIRRAVDGAFADGHATFDAGGATGTREMVDAVLTHLRQ